MFVRSLVNSLPDATDRHGSDGSMTSDATLVESSPGEGAWQGLCRAPRRCASDGRLRSCSPPPRQPPTAATNPSEMPTRGTETLLTAMECADGPPSVLMARLLAYHASRADRGRQQQPRDEPRGPDADGKQRPDDTSLPPLRTLDLPKFLATVARARLKHDYSRGLDPAEADRVFREGLEGLFADQPAARVAVRRGSGSIPGCAVAEVPSALPDLRASWSAKDPNVFWLPPLKD
ncbi:hypothetical protein DFJ74DRAFT_726177 [Hyaloraphidium curvatum]|nr:hypothetical protein DFJ74DRAFT_726177 [Hyaloraphidium curvatum]